MPTLEKTLIENEFRAFVLDCPHLDLRHPSHRADMFALMMFQHPGLLASIMDLPRAERKALCELVLPKIEIQRRALGRDVRLWVTNRRAFFWAVLIFAAAPYLVWALVVSGALHK